MKINTIVPYCNSYNIQNPRNRKNSNYNDISFEAKPRVDKSPERFQRVFLDKTPTTVKEFLNSLDDRFKYSPIKAQGLAFINLVHAKNVQDVKKLFPKEELFRDLKDYKDIKAKKGLFGIYREFKDLYENGILKSGEDLSVYFLKKIFVEAKLVSEINKDLEDDLDTDFRNEFKHQHKDKNYIDDKSLKAYGIHFPNQEYWNALRYTREGYSDWIGGIISAATKGNQKPKTDEEIRESAGRWQKLSPEEKTDIINRMKKGAEPLRFAMIDTWNHSEKLLRELSKFLTEQQILKPIDLLYSTEEFSLYQSKVMTEFWENHKDLSQEFGQNFKLARKRIDEAIALGKFEELKQEILHEKALREKAFELEKEREAQKLKDLELEKFEKTPPDIDYKKTFKETYRLKIDPNRILPLSYINDITDVMFETYPQNRIEQLTYCLKNNLFEIIEFKDLPIKTTVYKHALEAAISNELCSKGAPSDLYELELPDLTAKYAEKMKGNPAKKQYPDVRKIEYFYNKYKKELSEENLIDIRNKYFLFDQEKMNCEEDMQKVMNYLKSYGRSLLILFSDKSAFPISVKKSFNNKFLNLMPEEIQKFCFPHFESSKEINEETDIKQIRDSINRRYHFLPNDLLYTFSQEIANAIRCHRALRFYNSDAEIYSIKNYKENMCVKNNSEQLDVTPVTLTKSVIHINSKLKFLAMEQALADELFEITQDELVYKLELEELCNFFEIFSLQKTHNAVFINNGTDLIILQAKAKPKGYLLKYKYNEYLDKLQSNTKKFLAEDNETINNKEELMHCLNTVKNNPVRDKYILDRIEQYIYLDEE